MKRRGHVWGLWSAVGRLMADCRGQAMTEYVVLMAVVVGVSAYLYHPNNGIYLAIREIFDNAGLVLILPGP